MTLKVDGDVESFDSQQFVAKLVESLGKGVRAEDIVVKSVRAGSVIVEVCACVCVRVCVCVRRICFVRAYVVHDVRSSASDLAHACDRSTYYVCHCRFFGKEDLSVRG